MAQTAAELAGPCLEKICEIASGRKYTKLRHEAKVRFLQHLSFAPYMSTISSEPALEQLCGHVEIWLLHVQELLSNLGEALRPVEPRDAQQAALEPASEPAESGESKDSVAQLQPSPEAAQENSAAAKEASELAAPESSDAWGAEGAGEKPQLDVQSAPSAAEKLEQEIAATAEQVTLTQRFQGPA